MIFDTHAHYDDEAFDEDRDVLLESMESGGICNIVNVAASMESCKTSIELAESFPFVYAAVGVHPSELVGLTDKDMNLLETYLAHPKVVALGEIGLDYHYPDTDEKMQKEFFVRQLAIARRKNKPVIIHSRDAAADTMDIIKAERAYEMGGVIHCYSYSYEMARQYVEMGYYIGIGGVVTFKNARKLKECAANLPLDRIVLETDCPYLSPEPGRGKRNSSLNLPYVVTEIANLRGISEDEVREVTLRNAKKMYNLI